MPDPVNVLYISGSGRSGSTLFGRLLHQYTPFCYVGELRYFWERYPQGTQVRCNCGETLAACPFWHSVLEEAFGSPDAVDFPRMQALYRRVDRVRHLPAVFASRSPQFRADLQAYREALAALYRGIAAVSGSQVILDGSKDISTLFILNGTPGIRLSFIQLIRDSRGVAYSWGKRKQLPEPSAGRQYMDTYTPFQSGIRWLFNHLANEALGRTNSRRLPVRYETFITRPHAVFREIFRHYNLTCPFPPDEQAARFEITRHSHSFSGNTNRFESGTLELRTDDAWKTQFPAGKRILVTALTWPLLLKYGYFKDPA